jgi:hypothetical protein
LSALNETHLLSNDIRAFATHEWFAMAKSGSKHNPTGVSSGWAASKAFTLN